MGTIVLYTYRDLVELFKVKPTTIRNWRWKGDFEILGYRRLGRWAKEVVISEEEVKKLIHKKLIKKL